MTEAAAYDYFNSQATVLKLDAKIISPDNIRANNNTNFGAADC